MPRADRNHSRIRIVGTTNQSRPPDDSQAQPKASIAGRFHFLLSRARGEGVVYKWSCRGCDSPQILETRFSSPVSQHGRLGCIRAGKALGSSSEPGFGGVTGVVTSIDFVSAGLDLDNASDAFNPHDLGER